MQRSSGGHFRVIAHAGNTAPFEEILQRWWTVGNSVSDLTSSRFESETSRTRHERVTARRFYLPAKPKTRIFCNLAQSENFRKDHKGRFGSKKRCPLFQP